MPLTKEQILQDFALLDLAKLQKLHDYSQNLLIPDEDLLVNVTYSQMLNKIFALANQYFPAWTDRSESDFGRFLAELICLFSEKDFWYINAFANEAIFQKISIYSDAFVRATCLGYDPGLCRGASAQFDVTFGPSASPTTYKRGELVLAFTNLPYKFTNDEEFTVPVSGSNTILPLILSEGVQAIQNVSYNGHTIFIDRKMVDVESIEVVINNLKWDRVRAFGRSSANSPHFIVVPEENGSFSIFFGEDGYGQSVTLGTAVKLYYRAVKGSAANFAVTSPVNINTSLPARPALAASMVTDATGGSEPESLASIKQNVPLYFSSKKAAINEVVMEAILNSYPEVLKSKVTSLGSNAYFRIIPKAGGVAPGSLLTTIENRINELLMLGYTAVGLPTTYISTANVDMTVYVLSGYSLTQTETLVRQLVTDYTDPLVLAQYGQDFDLSELSLLIRSRVPGVQNVVFNQVHSLPPANVSVAPVEILDKLLSNQLTVTVLAV